MKKKFGELLLERRIITPDQLADALSLQRRRGMRLGAALVARGHITETQLVDALGSALGLKVVDLQQVTINAEAVKLVSPRFAIEHELIPYAIRDGRGGRKIVTIAMSDPMNVRIVDELSFKTNAQIETVLARPSDIDQAITKHFGLRFRTSEAYGRDVNGEDLLSLSSADGEVTEMTILRKGGGEEVVDTKAGRAPTPGYAAGLLDNVPITVVAPLPAAAPRSEEVSAVLLTEEVSASTPVDPVLATPVPPKGYTTGLIAPGGGWASVTGTQAVPPHRALPNAEVPTAAGLLPPLPGPSMQGAGTGVMAKPSFGAAGTSSGPALTPPAAQPGAVRPTQTLIDPTGALSALPRLPPIPGTSAGPVVPREQSPAATPVAPMAPLTSAAVAAAGAVAPAPPRTLASNPYFDDTLGALLDAAGSSANTEAVLRLERKFWALMRVLAKKGLLTNDDFMQELAEEDR